jgi:hypothetical protein
MTYSIDDALAYISKVDWRFAKTMPTIPHEYTLREWRPELEPEFLALAHLIRTEGTIEPWPVIRPKYHMHYLVVGDNKYWAMGPPFGDSGPLENMWIVNRQRHPDPQVMLDEQRSTASTPHTRSSAGVTVH